MPNTSLKNWQTISTTDIIEDLPWLKLSADHVRLPNGRRIERFYHLHLPEYAVIVPITTDGLIVMERQYKHAIGSVIVNLPAGYLNAGELPLTAAKRELLEETGFGAENWCHLGSFCIDGNRGCGKVHAFVASIASRVAEPIEEETEQVEIVLTTPAEAMKLLFDGRIPTSGPALALSLAFLSPLAPLAFHEGD